jgi:hypothetical protein
MNSKSKDQLIALLQESARSNGDCPLGANAFFRQTGLSKQTLWDVGIRSYGDLCEIAGYQRNELKKSIDTDRLLESLAVLTEKLGRYPDTTDRHIAHRSDSTFPSSRAFLTAQKKNGSLDRQLQAWCRSRPQYATALKIVDAKLSQAETSRPPSQTKKIVAGYVYLLRYGNTGRDYKIGMSDDAGRRHSQLSGMFPGDLRIVHVIETDDPRGIERYWHERFDTKLVKGKKEIFRLDASDVSAFKSRKYQ